MGDIFYVRSIRPNDPNNKLRYVLLLTLDITANFELVAIKLLLA